MPLNGGSVVRNYPVLGISWEDRSGGSSDDDDVNDSHDGDDKLEMPNKMMDARKSNDRYFEFEDWCRLILSAGDKQQGRVRF